MAISHVHASADVVTQAAQQPKKPTQTQGTAQPNSSTKIEQKPAQVAQTIQAQTTNQAPKPVPNSQGQTTGTILNATA